MKPPLEGRFNHFDISYLIGIIFKKDFRKCCGNIDRKQWLQDVRLRRLKDKQFKINMKSRCEINAGLFCHCVRDGTTE